MQFETPEPGSARDWLRRARSDFALARVGPQPDVMYNELCFHAQQTVTNRKANLDLAICDS